MKVIRGNSATLIVLLMLLSANAFGQSVYTYVDIYYDSDQNTVNGMAVNAISYDVAYYYVGVLAAYLFADGNVVDSGVEYGANAAIFLSSTATPETDYSMHGISYVSAFFYDVYYLCWC